MMSFKENSQSSKCVNHKQRILFPRNEVCRRLVDICRLLKKQGVHSAIVMKSAGLTYTGIADTAQCRRCNLEVSGWTEDMDPFTIHAQHSSECSFVQSIQSKNQTSSCSCRVRTTNNQENPSKYQKIDSNTENLLVEVKILKEVRRRTFSHWPHRQAPSQAQMIDAGFFQCNVGDRVICLYCNLICQEWSPHMDDPGEVHRILSPQCPYVLYMLKSRQTSSLSILNENSTSNVTARSNEIVQASACHIGYIEIPKRQASFSSWPQEALPSVDNLVRAGFFYTGTKTIVTCFYCNGSLQNWGSKDDPLVEHSRWFPHCAYAKQLCGDELYRKIQKSKRITQELSKANQSEKNGASTSDQSMNRSPLQIPDESTLSRLVAARLDLPISQSLLNRNFKLSIIKRCWEDQLRLKQDDFATDCDVLVACIILQKQIDHINGNKENIIVPTIKMKTIREKEQAETLAPQQTTSSASVAILEESHELNPSNDMNIKASESLIKSTTDSITSAQKPELKNNLETSSSSSNLCVLCLTEQKRLACMPCGHMATCVPCGHSLRTCPICRRGIEAFVRIYI